MLWHREHYWACFSRRRNSSTRIHIHPFIATTTTNCIRRIPQRRHFCCGWPSVDLEAWKKVELSKKLLRHYFGPFRVIRQTSPVNYAVRLASPTQPFALIKTKSGTSPTWEFKTGRRQPCNTATAEEEGCCSKQKDDVEEERKNARSLILFKDSSGQLVPFSPLYIKQLFQPIALLIIF